MASFRVHISFGVAAGVLGCIGLASLALANAPGLCIAVFALATLGSVLPDMDSDSGIPFHVAFGSLTVVASSLAFLSVYRDAPAHWQTLVLVAGGTAVFVWVVVGYVFKRFTRHRGMAHSLAAALLAGLITFFLASRFYFTDSQAFLLGAAIVAGYVIHLILDEVWAAVNFNGKLFVPNKALGSALKIAGSDTVANVLVFGAIIFLAAGNVARLWNLAETFWRTVASK